jgi:hypothetical protein
VRFTKSRQQLFDRIRHCASVAPAWGAMHGGGSLNDAEAFWRANKDRPPRCGKLARLLRAGELKAIYIPESTDEAIRDLCRARSDAVDDLRRSRHRLKALLLRHGYRYHGKSAWSQAHMRYLRELVLPDPAMKVILEDYLMAISAPRTNPTGETAMIDRLASWRLKPAVDALMAFKGFQLLAAIIVCGSVPTDNPRKHERQTHRPFQDCVFASKAVSHP